MTRSSVPTVHCGDAVGGPLSGVWITSGPSWDGRVVARTGPGGHVVWHGGRYVWLLARRVWAWEVTG